MVAQFVKKHKKLFAFAIVVVVIAVIFGIDFCISKTYKMEVNSMSEEIVYADNKRPVTIEILLTQFGEPVEGHSLYAVAVGGGRLKANRVLTNEKGIAEFVYVPYSSNRFMPAVPITINVIDESNSWVFEVNAKFSTVIDLVDKES